MHIFFKTDNIFELIKLLIKKNRNDNSSVCVLFKTNAQCQEFSSYLWKAFDCIAHGLALDGFDQNVMIDIKEHKKDVLIIVEDAIFDQLHYKKIFFIGDCYKDQYQGKHFSYFDKKWSSQE